MSKISEFEDKIIKKGMSDEDFETYKVLLKRVHGNYSKQQHCYTTAIQFPRQYTAQAIRLIEHGLKAFPDTWSSTYTSYSHMGKLYENDEQYQKAYDAYLSATASLGENRASYESLLAGYLMWMRLHMDRFQYSEELEKLYLQNQQLDPFTKSFVNTEFRLLVANIVISLHHQRDDEAREACKQAVAMLEPDHIGKLQHILDKHRYQDTLNETSESREFLKKISADLK